MTTEPLIDISNTERLTVDEYWALRQAGVFSAYYKMELLDGELWGVRQWADDEDETDETNHVMLQRVDNRWIVVES